MVRIPICESSFISYERITFYYARKNKVCNQMNQIGSSRLNVCLLGLKLRYEQK